jgi:cytochrome c oxidase subunit 1/cytochrome c oxidase subunit I+III
VPYTTAIYSPGLNMDFYAVALLFRAISTTAGAINFIILRKATASKPRSLWPTSQQSI